MSIATEKASIIPLKYNTLLSVVAVLVITTIVLVWSAESREKEFLQSQRNLAENSVSGVANQISNKISDLRQSIKLFAEKEKTLLRKIIENPGDLDAYDHLVDIAKTEFPSAVAITIADKSGTPYIEDFDGFILDICRKDIKKFSKMRHPPEVFIHPNPLAYHIDIMVKVDIGLGKQTIFFVSFSPDLISRILNNGELYSHKLMLVKNDDTGLIEITSKGARDTLSIDKLHLSEDETNKVIYSRTVSHTSWKLLDLPVNDYLSKHCSEIWNETLTIISLLFTFSILMLFLHHRTEKKANLKTEAAIKKKIAAEDASKAKSYFLANMSHEIRTPLTAIIGYGETLLRSDQTMKERVDSVNTIIDSGEHLLSLINNILDVSKIEAQKLVLEKAEVSPYKLLNDVEQIISGQLKNKDVEFSIHYDFPLPKSIKSDAVRLKQILLNLCSNATKFTGKGYIRVTMRYEKTTDQLYFSVQDSGIGMSEESVGKVFDSFTQADSSTTRKYGGTGLGLTLSKQLAELLGGNIEIDSKFGIGSTFVIHTPTNIQLDNNLVYDVSDIPKREEKNVGDLNNHKLSGRVLLAEDNENNQKLIKHHLEKMGLDVLAVSNGKQAIDKSLAEHFDLIYMDMQMPIMGGVEAVETLRSKGYKGAIVALTANALQEDKKKCLNAGCNDYVTKPIHYNKLYEVSKQYMVESHDDSKLEPIYSTILDEDGGLEDLIRNFIDSLETTMNKLKIAFKEKEWELLSQILHQVKGLGGGYGYPEISDIAAKIEFQLINENYQEVSNLLTGLYNLFERAVLGRQQYQENPGNKAGL